MILPGQLRLFEFGTVRLELVGMESTIPGVVECVEYARWAVKSSFAKRKGKFPAEALDDLQQEISLWVIENHKSFDRSKKWQHYVRVRATGLIKDFHKLNRAYSREMKRQRLIDDPEGNENNLDLILQLEGFSSPAESIQRPVNLDMLERLAVADRDLHAFVRWCILDQNIAEIAVPFGVTEQMVWIHIEAFIERFSLPRSRWLVRPDYIQALYALGISEHFGFPHRDQSDLQAFKIGHGEAKVDLFDMEAPRKVDDVQMVFSFESASA